MEQQNKTMDHITIIVTGREYNKEEEEEGKDAEEADCKNRFVIQNRRAFNGAAR